jgi:formylglycine-generating enzyme required for sulfatase activity
VDPEKPALDLALLVERLRDANFRIDTRQYLTAHDLLFSMAASGTLLDDDVDRLASCLGPIFCTSPDEQARFRQEVERWRRGTATARDTATPKPQPVPPPPPSSPSPFQRWRRARWWQCAAVVAIGIAIVTALLTAWYYIPVTVRGRVQVQLSSGEIVAPSAAPASLQLRSDNGSLKVDANGAFSLTVARARSVAVQVTLEGFQPVTREIAGSTTADDALITLVPETGRLPSGPVPDRQATPDPIGVIPSGQTSRRGVRWSAVAFGAMATAVVGFVLLWLWAQLRHRLALKRLPVHGDPESVTLAVVDTPILPASEPALNRVAIALRRPREGTVLDLDVPATVNFTARSAGFLGPVFSTRRAMPEYVVLVSRRQADDHQARVFGALFSYFGAQDVVVDTYSFSEDPRVCVFDATGQSFLLRDVIERHHRATLIVCGETQCAFNRVSGRLATWIETIPAHVERVFLTPEAPDRWTDREYTLGRAGFLVLPANDAGWQVLADPDGRPAAERLFPAPYTRGFPPMVGTDERRWLDRNDPPPGEIERLLRGLQGFLGPDGFVWMCACAVYPEISWALTLRLRGETSPGLLMPLGRLPWFRHAFMPPWLRSALVARIPEPVEDRLRKELEGLLADLARQSDHGKSGSALQIGRWVGPIDLMMAPPPGSPLHDHVFLGFMTGGHHPLSLEVPRALKRLFSRQPAAFSDDRPAARSGPPLLARLVGALRLWSALHRAAAHAVAACAIALLMIFPLTHLLALDEISGVDEAMWFVEIPEGPIALGQSASNTVNLRAFFISRTEVTAGQYQACVAAGACTGGTIARNLPLGSAGEAPDWPVRNVTWEEALQYCKWLEAKLRARTGATGAIVDALQGRRGGGPWQVTLPSEPEWEKAATGGDGRRYPWGNDLDAFRTNDQAARYGQPTAVGSFPRGASPLGVMDMAGNVQEWTRTAATPQYAADRYAIDDGRENLDPASAAARAVRGGAFDSPGEALLSTARYVTAASTRASDLGFRVVISPIGASPLPRLETTAAGTPPRTPAAAAINSTSATGTVGARCPADVVESMVVRTRPDFRSVEEVSIDLTQAVVFADPNSNGSIAPNLITLTRHPSKQAVPLTVVERAYASRDDPKRIEIVGTPAFTWTPQQDQDLEVSVGPIQLECGPTTIVHRSSVIDSQEKQFQQLERARARALLEKNRAKGR